MLVAFGGPPSALRRPLGGHPYLAAAARSIASCPCTSVPAARPRGHLEGVHCEGSLLSRPSTARAQKKPPARARQRIGAARLRDLRTQRAGAPDGCSSRPLALGVSSPFEAVLHEVLESLNARVEVSTSEITLHAAQNTTGWQMPCARRGAEPSRLVGLHRGPIEVETSHGPQRARRESASPGPRGGAERAFGRLYVCRETSPAEFTSISCLRSTLYPCG